MVNINVSGGVANNGSNTPIVDAGYGCPYWFEADIRILTPDRVVSGGTTSSSTVKDANFNVVSGATTARDYTFDIIHYPRPEGLTPDITFEIIGGTGGFTLDNSTNPPTFRSTIHNRLETLRVQSPSLNAVYEGTIRSRVVSGTGSTTFSSWVTNSLAKHCSDAIDTRLVGKSRASAIQIYNSSNAEKRVGNYSRNTSLWCADIVDKLTFIIPWIRPGGNDISTGYFFGATPITKRHVLFPAHIAFQNNTIYDFVNIDNTRSQRTQIQRKISPSYNAGTFEFDFCVGLLNSDLPNWVYIPKLLPSNWRSYLPSIEYRIPVVSTHQAEYAAVRDTSVVNASNFVFYAQPTNTKRNEFYQAVENGDSGNPQFLIINDNPVLVSTWTFGGAGGGLCYGDFIDDINQLIVDVDTLAGINTGYTLSTVDLSSFPVY